MIREIDFTNGVDCGAGYDIRAYLDGEGGAVRIYRVRDRKAIYATVSDESWLRMLADGGSVPDESEPGAEDEFNRLYAEFNVLADDDDIGCSESA